MKENSRRAYLVRAAAIAAITAAALCLSACGGNKAQETSAAETKAASAQETVKAEAEKTETGKAAESEKAAETAKTSETTGASAGAKVGGTEAASETEAAPETTAAPETVHDVSELYAGLRDAVDVQMLPDVSEIPWGDDDIVPPSPYESVTIANLQGRWVNEYEEDGVNIQEILTVSGSRGRIETFMDGEKRGVWNDDGDISIEDRSYRGVCPAFRINAEDGMNLCTIYIRWVKDDRFYDGGFCCEWKKDMKAPVELFTETVDLDHLQGVWYSEMTDGAGLYQDVLVVDGDRASIYEEINGVPSDIWNGSGQAEFVVMADNYPFSYIPELLINKDEGSGAGGIAGIYISGIFDSYFYDAGHGRRWIKIPEEGFSQD